MPHGNGTSNRRDQILTRATDLFARSGYVGTSVRQIARSCGITEAAIYRHFDSKRHLYEEVIRAKAREMLDKLWHGRGGYVAGFYTDDPSIGLDPMVQRMASETFLAGL